MRFFKINQCTKRFVPAFLTKIHTFNPQTHDFIMKCENLPVTCIRRYCQLKNLLVSWSGDQPFLKKRKHFSFKWSSSFKRTMIKERNEQCFVMLVGGGGCYIIHFVIANVVWWNLYEKEYATWRDIRFYESLAQLQDELPCRFSKAH